MIAIKQKEDCVGCNACVQRCPKQCISMKEDEQGFLYPKVDLDKCIDCHLCEKVCPVINQADSREPLHAYAARNKNPEVQRTSSSGGIFYALAEKIIADGGVVFGARFNDYWEVVHDYAETLEGVKAFKGSKYVQSLIGDNFKKAETFLKEGRKVLFSGTPCQIAGLKLFLRKDYEDQLLLIDTACHGVPSPMIWKDFICQTSNDNGFLPQEITDISFRDKRNGWEKYGMRINFLSQSENKEWFMPMHDNIYMQGFLKDLYLRPSCYECPAKCGKSHSDITLADFWGIRNRYPKLYDEGYHSLVLANSNNGIRALESIPIDKEDAEYSKALAVNPAMERSAIKPNVYALFWHQYHMEGISAIKDIVTSMKPSLLKRALNRIKRVIR